jgi:hypothetical protein
MKIKTFLTTILVIVLSSNLFAQPEEAEAPMFGRLLPFIEQNKSNNKAIGDIEKSGANEIINNYRLQIENKTNTKITIKEVKANESCVISFKNKKIAPNKYSDIILKFSSEESVIAVKERIVTVVIERKIDGKIVTEEQKFVISENKEE